MKNIPFSYLLWIFCLLFSGSLVYTQDFVQKKIISENLLLFIGENNPSLFICKTAITVEKQVHKLAINMQPSDIKHSENSAILDNYFSDVIKVQIPYLANSFPKGAT